MNSDPIPELPEHAADLEIEGLLGQELSYKAEEGIRQMQGRIDGLQKEIAIIVGNDNLSADYVRRARARIVPQLNDARRRLAEYELMLKSRN